VSVFLNFFFLYCVECVLIAQLSVAFVSGSIALFSSEMKGRLFVPNAEEKKCVIVSSKTGKLIDIDVEAVKNAVRMLDSSPALA